MFYLKDSSGQVVRAVNWSTEKIIFLQRHDTQRVEAIENLSSYDALKIPYTILDVVDKNEFLKSRLHVVKELKGALTLVQEADQILPNVALPQDDKKSFELIVKRSAQVSGGLALLFYGLSFIIKAAVPPTVELQIVQVMDRKQIEKSVVMPMSAEKKLAHHVTKTPHHVIAKSVVRKNSHAAQSSGVLGILGSLKKSSQQGGLNLNDAGASAGIGRGGNQGSGGMQTSVYAKGMFSAPLGSGGKANGAGGYGTRGKGGGKAGYGQVSLVGSGSSFFQPVESEAWFGGGLDRNEIAAVINRHLSEVRYCYEQGLQQKPKLAGRLSMNFMIGPNGIVSTAKVMNSSLGHVAVETCIRDHLKTWNFPKPEGGVTVKVSYPFILRRVSDT